MMRGWKRRAAMLAGLGTILSSPLGAQLYWHSPDFRGAPVVGDEPTIVIPLPGANDVEKRANTVWTLRAGLNVAALQCQFAPGLMTVHYYNDILKYHAAELEAARAALAGYFKRTAGKKADTLFDEYTTRTYNGFSTFHAQLGFCETAGSIGREAVARPKGTLYLTAQRRMREFRNSLVPKGDGLFGFVVSVNSFPLPSLDASCWNKNDLLLQKCAGPTSL